MKRLLKKIWKPAGKAMKHQAPFRLFDNGTVIIPFNSLDLFGEEFISKLTDRDIYQIVYSLLRDVV